MKNIVPCLLSLLILPCLAVPGNAPYAQEAPDRPPNIVLAIRDDHGYPYFGFTGSEHVRTPNLDLLAREGTADAAMQLYDMERDPEAVENVAGGRPDLAARFMEAIAAWKADIVSSTE